MGLGIYIDWEDLVGGGGGGGGALEGKITASLLTH